LLFITEADSPLIVTIGFYPTPTAACFWRHSSRNVPSSLCLLSLT